MGPGEGPVLSIPMEKQALRKQMMEARAELGGAKRERLSALAQAALMSAPAFGSARTVLLYQAFRDEVATEAIAAEAVAAGKRLALPRVIKESRGLVLHQYSGDPATLAIGAYGIQEPCPEWSVVNPGEVDLVVVPGVAFDRAGNRLGYGGGYYDRLLPLVRSANPAVCLIGLAYSFQLVLALPADPHDIPVDLVATDAGLLHPVIRT